MDKSEQLDQASTHKEPDDYLLEDIDPGTNKSIVNKKLPDNSRNLLAAPSNLRGSQTQRRRPPSYKPIPLN